MGQLIHAVAHGLVADDTIMLGNLVGGEGLSDNTLYYVLASGLTADDFKVGLTSGGAALDFTTDITDGVVVRSDTYTVVTDGVMDPPDPPATPSAPTLASSVFANIVQMKVTIP